LAVQIPAVPNNWVKLRIKDSCCGKLLLLLSPARFCRGIGFKYILYVLIMHIHKQFYRHLHLHSIMKLVYCYLLAAWRDRYVFMMFMH
jgi:hypothetical protein